MAQPGNFTPILLYGSSTPTNVPLAANLTNSATGFEIAINVADKNLFFKDSGGVVNTVPIRQSSTSSNGWLSSTDWNTFNSKAPATSGTSILYGNGTGGFSNVTIGSGISFAGGTLSATGTGGTVTSVAALTIGTTGTDLSSTVANSTTTPVITLNVPTASAANRGALSAADWSTFNGKQAALVSGTNIKTVGGVTLLGSGDVGTIGVAYGGTGLTSLTANRIPYGAGTSAFASSANFTYDGSTLALNGSAQIYGARGLFVQGDLAGGSPFVTGGALEFGANSTDATIQAFNRNSFPAYNLNIIAGTDINFKPGTAQAVKMFASGGVSIGNTTNPGATNLSVSGSGFFGATAAAASERLNVTCSVANFAQRIYNSNAAPAGLAVLYTGASPNSTGSAAFYFQDSTTLRLEVRSNGGIANYSGNNVNLSDERTKKDILNASNYLAKICAIPVRTFRYKDQTDDALTLGVIAQEVEKVAPELVDADGFGDNPDDGVPLKAVYQTDLTFAVMKALQELNDKFDAYVASHP